MNLTQISFKFLFTVTVLLNGFLYSVSSQAQNSELKSSLQQTFTNYLIRGIAEAGKSPTSHIMTVQVGSLKETQALLEAHLKTSAAQSQFQQSYYSYLLDLYTWTIEVHETNYEFYTTSIYPSEIRAKSLKLITQYKLQVIERTHQLLNDLRWGSKTTVLLPSDLNLLATDLSMILSHISENFIPLNLEETKAFENSVLKEWAKLTAKFFRGLDLRSTDLSSRMLESHFYSSLSILDRLPDYLFLTEELLKSANRSLLKPRAGADSVAVYRSTTFAILYINQMTKLAKTNQEKEQLLESLMNPSDLKSYRDFNGELIPESMVDFILSEDLKLTEFLELLNQVKVDYPESVDNFPKAPLEKMDPDLKKFLVGQMMVLSYSLDKHMVNYSILVDMFFKGTIPFVDEDKINQELPFSSGSVDVRSFVALDPILDNMVYVLTHNPYLNLTVREFNEKLLWSFLSLGSKVENLTATTYMNLERLFEFYRKAKLKSSWLKRLAFEMAEIAIEQGSINFWTMQMAAIDYLLVLEPENQYYQMTKIQLQDLRPEHDLDVIKNKYDSFEYGLKDSDAGEDDLAHGLQTYSPYQFSNVVFDSPKPVQFGASQTCAKYLGK